MSDSTLVIAGSLTLLAAAIHAIGGQLWIVRKLDADRLAATPFGSATMTRAMLGVCWHLTTVGFLAAAGALLAAGTALDGDAAQALAVVGAIQVTACAAVIVGLGALLTRSPHFIYRHPAPALVTITAALAWFGAA